MNNASIEAKGDVAERARADRVASLRKSRGRFRVSTLLLGLAAFFVWCDVSAGAGNETPIAKSIVTDASTQAQINSKGAKAPKVKPPKHLSYPSPQTLNTSTAVQSDVDGDGHGDGLRGLAGVADRSQLGWRNRCATSADRHWR